MNQEWIEAFSCGPAVNYLDRQSRPTSEEKNLQRMVSSGMKEDRGMVDGGALGFHSDAAKVVNANLDVGQA